jgi:hypothetical protein
MSKKYGIVSPPSTSRYVNFVANKDEDLTPIVGRLVFFDQTVAGDVYRSIGTVSNISTENSDFNATYQNIVSSNPGYSKTNRDFRKTEFSIQAVFKQVGTGWQQYGSALPTSPSTNSDVYLLTEETVEQMLSEGDYPTVGFFRGMQTTPLPLNVPNFDSSRGAAHSAVLGKSGSGKTQLYGMVLGGYMKHENHAILAIDPQGQWASENGMIFSPQNFARGLGRKVSVIRVSEDIKLPMDIDVLTKMIDKINLWSRFRRMGTEQREAFSNEVAERIAATHNLDVEPRALLTTIFAGIAKSSNTLSRIYVKGERQDAFRDELKHLAGIPVFNDEGEERIFTEEDDADKEAVWDKVLSAFKPLHSLFASKNLTGGVRRPLGGNRGFLGEVFQVRTADSEPAPYVILDMSPNIELHAKASLDPSNDSGFAMQKLLDNQDIKALILTMVLEEMKKASEIAFAAGGGNLNTQIMFDEAWRYAPEGRATPEIEALASMLEGFALDTRKFGIGWTYILQSPSDLKYGIWRQLTYVFAGHGLVGEDVKRLEGLTDDPKQIDLYRQFISPASTGDYPFMVMGPISPLIFTSSPTFLNAFKGNSEFLSANKLWVDAITSKRSLPSITEDFLKVKISKKRKPKPAAVVVPTETVEAANDTEETVEAPKPDSSYHVGKTYASVKPQIAVKTGTRTPTTPIVDDLGDTPF